MKKILFFGFVLFSFITQSLAQNEVLIKINHKLGGDKFNYGLETTNDLEIKFNVERLQYYLSGFNIIHDGGQVMSIKEKWFLIDANNESVLSLGELDIESIEKISFAVGVPESVNHLDPASYPSGHPLAPKAPSMHWGWAAGYRFVAFEGQAGDNLDRGFELHGLGDSNYLITEIEMQTNAVDGQIIFSIDADYTRAIDGIKIDNDIISHGLSGYAKICLENFNEYVFTAAEITSSNDEILDANILVYPNPSVNGLITIDNQNNDVNKLIISSIEGRMVAEQKLVKGSNSLTINKKGMYLLHFKTVHENTVTKKIIIQ